MNPSDPGTKRFLALLLAPLFLLVKSKLGIEVPETVQDLLLVSIITYVGGSHWKAAAVAKAEASAATAAGSVTTVQDAAAVLAPAPEVKP
jgi:hypothetical protein